MLTTTTDPYLHVDPRELPVAGCITLKRAAALLGINYGTAHMHASQGKLPIIRHEGRCLVPMKWVRERLIAADEAANAVLNAMDGGHHE